MKKREASTGPGFGPAPGHNTTWLLTTKNGEVKSSWGNTAFQACANVGLNLGQVSHIRPHERT